MTVLRRATPSGESTMSALAHAAAYAEPMPSTVAPVRAATRQRASGEGCAGLPL
jgi:hypothetical protein